MPKKGGAEEYSKKAQGQARKAAAAAAKKEEEGRKKQAIEDEKWKEGAKSGSKKEAEEAKKREAAAKKAERAALLAAEEASLKSAKPSAPKKAEKRTKGASGIDSALDSLDRREPQQNLALNASGIDNALDALSLTSNQAITIDRHPERRYKTAYATYEERRLPELKEEHPGLRLNQMKEMIKKEFEKSEENPFNQTGFVRFDASREEVERKRQEERVKIEKRLAGSK